MRDRRGQIWMWVPSGEAVLIVGSKHDPNEGWTMHDCFSLNDGATQGSVVEHDRLDWDTGDDEYWRRLA